MIALWLRRLWPYGIMAALGAVLWLTCARPPQPPENPAYDAIVTALNRRIKEDSVALDSARVALARARLRVTPALIRYRTLRDTLNVHDTVQVQTFVQQADSVVRACTELQSTAARFVSTCERRVADLTTDRDRWKRTVESHRPGRWDAVKEWGIRIGIGYAAFKLGVAAR